MNEKKAKNLARQLIEDTEVALAYAAGSWESQVCREFITMCRLMAQAEDPRPGGGA